VPLAEPATEVGEPPDVLLRSVTEGSAAELPTLLVVPPDAEAVAAAVDPAETAGD
jgi:hypothetical protein